MANPAETVVVIPMTESDWEKIQYVILSLPFDVIRSYDLTGGTLIIVCTTAVTTHAHDPRQRTTSIDNLDPDSTSQIMQIIRQLIRADVVENYRFSDTTLKMGTVPRN